ncbi:Fumarate reductase flavoprotein subunit [anaerobic digester metagenome]
MTALTEGKRDPILVKMVTERSGETIDWLIENGAVFNEEVKQGVGSTAYRAHSSAPDASGLVNKLMEAIEQKVDVHYNTAATELLFEDGKVVGAKAVQTDGTPLEIRANSVILSSGGFAGDKELVKKYAGEKTENMVYVGSPGTTGEMIEEAIKLGAATVDMDKLFNAPTNSVENKQLITAMVLSSGAVMINQDGERFCNETGSPNDYFNDILNTGDEYVYEVFDKSVVEKVYKLEAVYMKQGIVEEAANIEELAEKMNVPVETLKQSLDTYNASVNGAADPFGRNIFGKPLKEGPFYFIKVATGYLSTNGGLRIDETARVLKEDGTPIQGLYASGDAVGGYRPYGYVCGDANILAAVTGRIAGENASKK